MFVNGGKICPVSELVINYKGFVISIAFNKPLFDKGDKLCKTELLIKVGNKSVNHWFFNYLDPGPDEYEGELLYPDNFINDVTLDTLAFIKAKIDCGHFWRQKKTEEDKLKEERYIHDCCKCIFLGQYEKADLYVCLDDGVIDTVIARFSSATPDYLSGLTFAYAYGEDLSADENSDMRFTFEAFKRAISIGYRP
jgi:hypothetical protein